MSNEAAIKKDASKSIREALSDKVKGSDLSMTQMMGIGLLVGLLLATAHVMVVNDRNKKIWDKTEEKDRAKEKPDILFAAKQFDVIAVSALIITSSVAVSYFLSQTVEHPGKSGVSFSLDEW